MHRHENLFFYCDMIHYEMGSWDFELVVILLKSEEN